jgi:xanthine dehydrogenase accessory factor
MLDIYKELTNIILKNERAVLMTVVNTKGSVPRKAGAKMLIKEDGSFIGTIGGGSVEYAVKEKAMEIIKSGQPELMHFDLSGKEENATMICGGQMDVFFEPIAAQETLYLFGAGHIARSTATIGKLLGFHIVVIDPRPEYNNSEYLPDSDVLIVEDFSQAFAKLNIEEADYIIIYTYAHAMDEECLHFALGTKARYIGMIGSKKKVREIKERLIKRGISQEQLDSVHSPIGLDIGAETPEEIAVSILAEIIKVKRSPVQKTS